MADTSGLTAAQQGALLSLLRTIADGEIAAEEARCRLCEVSDFDPHGVFYGLADRADACGWINAYDVQSWFLQQPHGISSVPREDVADILVHYMSKDGELHYGGFARLVLPRGQHGSWFKELAMARSSGLASKSCAADRTRRISPEVAYRVCQIFEKELDLCRLLKFHRKTLKDLGVPMGSVLRFLDSSQGVCAGIGGLVSPEAMRRLLVDKLGSMSGPQCEALLRRVNASGARLVSFDEFAKYLAPPAPPVAAVLPPSLGSSFKESSLFATFPDPLSSTRISGSFPSSPLRESMRESRSPLRESLRESKSTLRESLREGRSPLRESFMQSKPLETSSSSRHGYVADDMLGSMSLQARPAPRLREPLGPQSPPTTKVPHLVQRDRSPVPGLRDRSPLREPVLPDRSPLRTSIGDRPYTVMPSPSPSTPLHSLLRPGVEAVDVQPRGASPVRRGESPVRLSGPWPSPVANIDRSISMDARNAFGSTRVNHLSPRLSISMNSALHRSSESALRDPGSQHRGGSVPPGASLLASPSVNKSSFRDDTKERLTRVALQTLARQAELDAELEDAKVQLPSACTLEAVFHTLDQASTGQVTVSDVRRLAEDFGASASFAGFCALVRDLRLRQPPQDIVTASLAAERLTMQDVGLLLFPAGSKEYSTTRAAENDADLLTQLYLLRHTEPCPRCGVRTQRNADCAGCPNVTCPVCGTSFRCFCVVGDPRGAQGRPEALSLAARYQLYRVLSVAVRAAEELERDRKKLALLLANDMCALPDIFVRVARSLPSIGLSDLRHALAQERLVLSEREIGLLWTRCAPLGSTFVTLPDFRRQLAPQSAWA